MSASQYDFSIEQGSSFSLSLVYKDQAGTPINLTDYCARLTLKTTSGDAITFSTTNTNDTEYKFTIDGPNGLLTLLIPAITTNSFDFTSARYDLEIQSPVEFYVGGGKQITRILYGIITLIKRFSDTNIPLDCQV